MASSAREEGDAGQKLAGRGWTGFKIIFSPSILWLFTFCGNPVSICNVLGVGQIAVVRHTRWLSFDSPYQILLQFDERSTLWLVVRYVMHGVIPGVLLPLTWWHLGILYK